MGHLSRRKCLDFEPWPSDGTGFNLSTYSQPATLRVCCKASSEAKYQKGGPGDPRLTLLGCAEQVGCLPLLPDEQLDGAVAGLLGGGSNCKKAGLAARYPDLQVLASLGVLLSSTAANLQNHGLVLHTAAPSEDCQGNIEDEIQY